MMPVAGVWCSEHHVLAGRGCQAKFPMGVLAELPAVQMCNPGQVEKATDRADPVRAEAKVIGTAAFDDAVSFGLAPQTLVDVEPHFHPAL